jgi:hypothetical protein
MSNVLEEAARMRATITALIEALVAAGGLTADSAARVNEPSREDVWREHRRLHRDRDDVDEA